MAPWHLSTAVLLVTQIAAPRVPTASVVAPDGGAFAFWTGRSKAKATATISRIDPRGATTWTYRIPGYAPKNAALLLHGDTLFAALYDSIASGCEVTALDARSGARRWQSRLVGVGPVAHSKYYNHVTIEVGAEGLVIRGHEAFGSYVEVLDRATGRQVSHRLLPR